MRELSLIINELSSKLSGLNDVIEASSVNTQRNSPEHVEIKFKPASNKFYSFKDCITDGHYHNVNVTLSNHEKDYTLSIRAVEGTHNERAVSVKLALIELKRHIEKLSPKKKVSTQTKN